MATVHAELTDEKAVLGREEFERLLELARQTEPVEVRLVEENAEGSLAQMAEQGHSFDFWKEIGEEIYSIHDGEAI